MELLDNAIAAISMGIEDYASEDEHRVLSSLRNLYAGVLLLLKEKLRRESPANSEDSLLYVELHPVRVNGSIVWRPKGKRPKTVDYAQIRERFDGLELKVAWERLDTLRRLRNDAEHHKLKQPRKIALEALSASFVVVKQIIEEHLGARPEQLLKENDCWGVMLREAETQRELEKQCRESFDSLEDVTPAAAKALPFVRCLERIS
jgi:hypothetical protein